MSDLNVITKNATKRPVGVWANLNKNDENEIIPDSSLSIDYEAHLNKLDKHFEAQTMVAV